MSARWLFGSAAAINLAIGLAMLCARDLSSAMLGVAAPTGSNILLANLSGGFVALFGGAYLLAARDPVRWRALIQLGAAGKAIAVACFAAAWLEGAISLKTTAFALIDLCYAPAFLVYLLRHPGADARR